MQVHQNIKIAVDAVVFGYTANQLQLLLIQRRFGQTKGKWALPGGFVLEDEVTWAEEKTGALRTVFENGNLVVDDSLATIRNRIQHF